MPDTETTNAETANALMTIIKVLTPLKSEVRRRTVDAAMTYLGEVTKAAPTETKAGAAGARERAGDENYPAAASKWMERHGISDEELDQVFHFNKDGSFAIHDAPGRSKKEKTLNAYILTGLGKYLTTNDKAFDDAPARAFCEDIACYDPANHAVHLKHKHPEFSGDKKKGYTLTNVGVKRGAELVKELAGAAK
jgi:hypothetical protein